MYVVSGGGERMVFRPAQSVLFRPCFGGGGGGCGGGLGPLSGEVGFVKVAAARRLRCLSGPPKRWPPEASLRHSLPAAIPLKEAEP